MSKPVNRMAAAMLKNEVEGNKKQLTFGRSEDFPHVVEIDIDKVHPDPDNARKVFDPEAMEGLKASIAEKGLKSPVWVRLHPEIDGEYMLIAGERRWRAMSEIGKTTIFALLYDDKDAAVLSAIENMQREDLKFIEEANYLAWLHTEKGYTQAELGAMIGKSQSIISRMLAAAQLPIAILTDLAGPHSDVPKSLIMEVCLAPTDEQKLALWESVKSGATVATLREEKKTGVVAPATPSATARVAVTAWHRATKSFEKHLSGLAKSSLTTEDKGMLAVIKQEIEDLLSDE